MSDVRVTTRDGRFDFLHPSDESQNVYIQHPIIAELTSNGKDALNVTAEVGAWDANREWWGDIVRGACESYLSRYISSSGPVVRALLQRMDEDPDVEDSFNRAFAAHRLAIIDKRRSSDDAERKRLVAVLEPTP